MKGGPLAMMIVALLLLQMVLAGSAMAGNPTDADEHRLP
jgi:hypothetical protein